MINIPSPKAIGGGVFTRNERIIKMNDNKLPFSDQERRGPWDAPLREFNKASTPIVVIIHDLAKETIENEFRLDYALYDDRKWLGKLTFWALNNGRSIETINANDWDNGK